MDKIIDAHHHFWHPARGDYGWMPQDDPVLSQPYAPVDLADALAATGVSGTVLVQAAPTVAETEYLLGIADSTPHVAGVVGWVDFENSEPATLQRLAGHPKLLGVRPMIQDIPDPDWMLRDDVQWAYQALIDLDLTFDALGFPQHIKNFTTLLARYPKLRTVLDHCLKPQLREHSNENFNHWAADMAQLAGESSAYCKLSGLVTEADANWQVDDLRPYVDHVLEHFTPQRVMWGSDWPVLRLRCEYERWFEVAHELTAQLSPAEKAAVFGGNAVEFYRLDTINRSAPQ